METRYYAVAAQAAFYIYLLATEWINFFPWNDIHSAKRSDQIKGTVFHSGMMAACMSAFIVGTNWAIWCAITWFVVLLTVEIFNWWIPYLFGIHLAEID